MLEVSRRLLCEPAPQRRGVPRGPGHPAGRPPAAVLSPGVACHRGRAAGLSRLVGDRLGPFLHGGRNRRPRFPAGVARACVQRRRTVGKQQSCRGGQAHEADQQRRAELQAISRLEPRIRKVAHDLTTGVAPGVGVVQDGELDSATLTVIDRPSVPRGHVVRCPRTRARVSSGFPASGCELRRPQCACRPRLGSDVLKHHADLTGRLPAPDQFLRRALNKSNQKLRYGAEGGIRTFGQSKIARFAAKSIGRKHQKRPKPSVQVQIRYKSRLQVRSPSERARDHSRLRRARGEIGRHRRIDARNRAGHQDGTCLMSLNTPASGRDWRVVHGCAFT